MNVLGISFGRKMANCEVLLKAALMECEKAGHTVRFIDAYDLEIKHCTGCLACVVGMVSGRGKGTCHLKDDFHILHDALMECDALLLACPSFAVTPTGLFKTINDRIGPSHDVTFLKACYEEGIAAGKDPEKLPDPRGWKPRVGALISVGGAMTENWLDFMIPTMYMFPMSMDIKVVDTYQYYGAMAITNVVGSDKAMARARQIGQNIVDALAAETEEDRVRWRGDHEGVCPVCHCSMLNLSPDRKTVECPVCGIYGSFTVDAEGALQVTFSEEEQLRSRLNIAGKIEHSTEIKTQAGCGGPIENLQEKLQPYKWK